ncbi:hypothetical protein [Chengkuizengella marina]|uniref:Uncharacterized protein n=1 Tax=Chengkuizengella marina TaxID=2507566 RepID=A0A6N9Q5Z9_9BACL|nr:hypothetical protein [Chengkuizengella marina]NBI30262.1 hypothetical protein [Chengkuizengella marina]
METMWIIIVSVTIIAIGFFVYPFLQRKGYVTVDSIHLTDQLLLFIKIILDKTSNYHNLKLVLNSIRDVLKYVDQLQNKNIEYKKQLTKSMITDELIGLDIEIDYENELLIDMIVDNSFKFVK